MSSSSRHILLSGITFITVLLISVITSFAESINYVYDDLNRLIQVQYENGAKIEYTYDEVGNRLLKQISDTGAPVTTASPLGGIYYSTQSVALTCRAQDATRYTTQPTAQHPRRHRVSFHPP